MTVDYDDLDERTFAPLHPRSPMKPLSKPFFVAGVQHSPDAARLPNILPPSAVVEIRHNPNNKFDPFALEVRVDGLFVGHVPRAEQTTWFYHQLRNVPVLAKPEGYNINAPLYERIAIRFVCNDMYITTVTKVGDINA